MEDLQDLQSVFDGPGLLGQYLNWQSGLVAAVVYVLMIVAWWKIFSKAGEAGWKSLIPIYNLFILCKIADTTGWKFLLLLIPIVDIVYYILLNIRLARAFGKGGGFAAGLIFLNSIFTLILGFGSAEYIGPRMASEGDNP